MCFTASSEDSRSLPASTMPLGDSQAPQSAQFFEGAGNIIVNDGQFAGVINNSAGKSSGVPWLDFLLSHCAPDALVDSKARQDPPRCAPDTREAIQKEILDWINLLTQSGLVMWLRGSAGSGKSAIAQTIAELLNNAKTPSASFFFSRISGSPTRVDGDRVLPTIIYQLCLLLPEYQDIVMKKLTQDPSLFERSRESQMDALFTKPLQQFSFRRLLRKLRQLRSVPLVIIIDGLDECRDPEIQCDLLRIIADAAASIRNRPVRFLIASRPETHITRTFDQYPDFQHSRLRSINLDADPDASMAILAFLRQEVRKIHETHPLRVHLSPSWPGQDILDLLVLKSSPQFILASTAMAYVASPKHQPTERLTTVINILNTPISPSADRPLQKLDTLYTFIFSSVEESHLEYVQAILGIIHLSSLEEYSLPPPTMSFLEGLLKLSSGNVYLYLEPLVSVLYLPQDPEQPIKSLHASLFDFLLNRARSCEQVLDLAYAKAGLIGYYFIHDLNNVVSFLEDPTVQSVSFTPDILLDAFITQKDEEIPAGNARALFILVELLFKILLNRGSPKDSLFILCPHVPVLDTSFAPSMYAMKSSIYRTRCRNVSKGEYQDLIDTFRNRKKDQLSLFYSLTNYMDTTPRVKLLTRWYYEVLDEVGRELHEIHWLRKGSEMRDLCEALTKAVLKWIGYNSTSEARRLKMLWKRISFNDPPV
ncbi:hypothetical protein CPB83DRAFT_850266 [Crepidotus variabilis]|uniref:Nephrocystin 3-like N-terminal domain-containing protein n=1 Tax=Crepidotus variabilis TaxID=179855 RepID=A0A9P6JSH4_9AGAR|nr:hypothetical protein CPB83DRAFT_850266 [Crepidotus variabilis]